MRRASLIPLVALAALGVSLLLGAAAASAARADTITVGEAANGSCRTLQRGDFLVVRLRSNPSTGYTWRVRSVTRPVLTLAGRSYVPPQDGLLGAPGTAIFRFRAAAFGRKVLRLAYARPWDAGTRPARTFTLRLSVVA